MNTTSYVTDGQCLYEIVAERVDRNYGLAGGTLRPVILGDLITGVTGSAGDLYMLALTPVMKAAHIASDPCQPPRIIQAP